MEPTVVGVARVDLTPTAPVMLGGFGQRTEPTIEVDDRTDAVAIHVARGDRRVVLVTADLISVPATVAEAVRAGLAARCGLEPHEVCVAASHTHSAPLPDAPAYRSGLVDALVEAGVAAVDTSRPAVVRSGVGRAVLGFNRWRPDDPDQVDPRVPVLVADDAATGEAMLVLFGAGCHPTTRGWDRNAVSADYPGVAKRLVAERTGAVAAFVNTTEADVVPFTSPRRDALDPRGYCGGSPDDTDAVGARLADEVVRVVDELRRAEPTAEPGEEPAVGAVTAELELLPALALLDETTATTRLASARAVLAAHLGDGFEADVPASGLWAAASAVVVERDLDDVEMRRLMIAVCHHLGASARLARGAPPGPVPVPVQVLRLGALELLALPGEPLVAVGREWARRAGHDAAFVVGLANAHLRYLPRAEHFAEPGADTRYETVTAGLTPDGVEALLDAGTELLAALR